mgnify:FL=1
MQPKDRAGEYISRTSVEQNLLDAGCCEEEIARFQACAARGNICGQVQILEARRRALLEEVHANEKRIHCLDYLIYRTRKGQ